MNRYGFAYGEVYEVELQRPRFERRDAPLREALAAAKPEDW